MLPEVHTIIAVMIAIDQNDETMIEQAEMNGMTAGEYDQEIVDSSENVKFLQVV
jgi:hypothetical protein